MDLLQFSGDRLQDYALRRNAAVRDALAVERAALAPLPTYRTIDYSVASAGVMRFGTISVGNVLYTVVDTARVTGSSPFSTVLNNIGA